MFKIVNFLAQLGPIFVLNPAYLIKSFKQN